MPFLRLAFENGQEFREYIYHVLLILELLKSFDIESGLLFHANGSWL